jgi:UDP-N-acetylmuramoyl-L-alanyl-D-glutamate--2,6-diaminopimelate ligase
MAKIAEQECDEIILTNEDPYDDDPQKIVDDMAKAITRKTPHVIMDRQEAIAKAISLAQKGDSVLITGKGTDPYIMGPNGTKIPWSDAEVARQELNKLTWK